MSTPRSPGSSSSAGGAFSNFLPRFRKEPSSAPSPPSSSPPDRSPSLSPVKFLGEQTQAVGRRLSISRGGKRELSSSSQTISPRTSLTNLGAHARQQQGMADGEASAAAAKSTVSPPKLTLTTNDSDGPSSAQSIFIPTPTDPHSQQGSLAAFVQDDIRTPTAELGSRLAERDLTVGAGSLSLHDVPSGVAPYQQERSITPRPPSPRKDSATSSSSSFAHSGSSSRRSSYHQQYPTEPTSSVSLAAPLASPSFSPNPSISGESKKSSRRRRGLSTSSFTRSRPKPSGGIANAIASMSKDLVNPATGLVQVRSRQSGDGAQAAGRPRGDTGESHGGSVGSSSSRKAKKAANRRSTASQEVNENGVSRTRASSISYLSSTDGNGTLSSPASFAGSPFISQRELSTALYDVNADHGSDFGDRRSAYSDEDDGDGMLDDSEDDLEGLPDSGEDYDDLPVTGFAVASVKRNAEFHALFENAVPEDDYLIEDYGCALQREILLQGRLYVSENHICFHANIFGWVTNLVLPFSEMIRIDKKMTALIIPNGIQISTLHAKHTFASFLSRDTTYDVIHNIWRLSHPHLPSANGAPSEAGSTRQSNVGDMSTDRVGRSVSPAASTGAGVARRQPTTCACGRKGEHYPEVAMDAVFPSAPEKIYNLIFSSGFAKDFMVNDMKLMDLQISDWKPQDASSSRLLERSMSYIKPLAGGFGPKQTKCELKDETVHCDFDDYVSMLTTTRTPDVPSGGVFSVKTRTCLTWAGANSTKVLVTTKVEWTGRSFIKGIIESSALAGQKEFHGALETAMRAYISDHLTEFHVDGVEDDPAAVAPTSPSAKGPGSPSLLGPMHGHEREHSQAEQAKKRAEQEGLTFQYGIDTVGKGAIEILKGAWALVESAYGLLSLHGVLAIVIAVLVVSNLWTLLSLKGSSSRSREVPIGRVSSRAQPPACRGGAYESPDSVADAVKVFLEDYMHRRPPESDVSPLEDVAAISAALDALDARIGRLRSQLPAAAVGEGAAVEVLDAVD